MDTFQTYMERSKGCFDTECPHGVDVLKDCEKCEAEYEEESHDTQRV